jgi:predicted amidohydrolase
MFENKEAVMKFKLGLCQIGGSMDKEEAKKNAEKHVRQAAENGAQVIVLPEMWDCPYSNDYFREYAEPADGPTVEFMSKLASDLGIYLIGGSISELDGDKVYNTSFSFNRQGDLIGRHRKVHLFDIDVEGGIRFMESDTLTAGEEMTVLDTEYCKIGVAICYDVRFPEWFRKMALAGAKLIVLPAAFNMTTGPAHWDLTMRARALDNQVYFAANAPARDENGVYVSYGNSCIASPWGDFIAHADEKEQIIIAELDLDRIEDVRKRLPTFEHLRREIYRVAE